MYKRLLLAGVVAFGAMTIGTPKDVSAATVNDYRAAYRNWCTAGGRMGACMSNQAAKVKEAKEGAELEYDLCLQNGGTAAKCELELTGEGGYWDIMAAGMR